MTQSFGFHLRRACWLFAFLLLQGAVASRHERARNCRCEYPTEHVYDINDWRRRALTDTILITERHEFKVIDGELVLPRYHPACRKVVFVCPDENARYPPWDYVCLSDGQSPPESTGNGKGKQHGMGKGKGKRKGKALSRPAIGLSKGFSTFNMGKVKGQIPPAEMGKGKRLTLPRKGKGGSHRETSVKGKSIVEQDPGNIFSKNKAQPIGKKSKKSKSNKSADGSYQTRWSTVILPPDNPLCIFPSKAPQTEVPTSSPNENTEGRSDQPSMQPSSEQHFRVSSEPSAYPTIPNSEIPTRAPAEGIQGRSDEPSYEPSPSPSRSNVQPSSSPTAGPTLLPTTVAPTSPPTAKNSEHPSSAPSSASSSAPSHRPSLQPASFTPSDLPSHVPTVILIPSDSPSDVPSVLPTAMTDPPSNVPSSQNKDPSETILTLRAPRTKRHVTNNHRLRPP